METIGKYEVHELASKLPMMPEDQFEHLKESIKTQGLMEPIMILSKKEPLIIDGRNRLKVCDELNIKPQFITLDEFLRTSSERRNNTIGTGDLIGLMKAEQSGDIEEIIKEIVIMKNVIRRHLSDFQQYLHLIAVEKYPENHRPKKELMNSYLSLIDLSEKLGWSIAKLKQAHWLEENAPEEIKQKLNSNETTIGEAYKDLHPKKSDWFDQHIGDENERLLVREAVKIKSKITKELGLLYLNEFIQIYNKINLDNYKEIWNQG